MLREGQLRLAESIIGFVGEGTFHTLIVVLPEEETFHAHHIPPISPSTPKRAKKSSLSPTSAPRIIRESGVQEGLALVSAMHLTALVIIQDEESGLHRDIMEWAEQLAPENPAYRHQQTGEDNGDADLKNLLLHHQVVLPITTGRIDFGPWQRLFYCGFDGQRTKRVIVKVIGE